MDIEVTFCIWEKNNAGAAVDDVTDDITVCQSKFWGQSLSAPQQICDEFFLQKRDKTNILSCNQNFLICP